MTPAMHPPIAAPPDDPVRAAMDDSHIRAELLAHSRSRLSLWLNDRPPTVREELAAEVVQEALARAWDRRADFDRTRATPAGWLHGFLSHVLSEQCRTIRKQPAQPTVHPGAWEALEGRFTKDDSDLSELLGCLPADQREIVSMHHLDGLSHREIAARLWISEPTSRVRLARAMNELRRLAAEKEAGR